MKRRNNKRDMDSRCTVCGAREKVIDVHGMKLSNLTPFSRICTDCINKGQDSNAGFKV